MLGRPIVSLHLMESPKSTGTTSESGTRTTLLVVTASPRVGLCKQALAKGWALRQSPEKIVCQPFHAAAVKCESVVCAHKSKTKEVVRLF